MANKKSLKAIDKLDGYDKILWDVRSKRIPPLRDDKVITAWNAMMIRSFAYTGQILEKQDYIDNNQAVIHTINVNYLGRDQSV